MHYYQKPIKEYLFHRAKNGEENKIGEKRGERKLSPIVSHTVFSDVSQLTQCLEEARKKNYELDADWVQFPGSGQWRRSKNERAMSGVW